MGCSLFTLLLFIKPKRLWTKDSTSQYPNIKRKITCKRINNADEKYCNIINSPFP